MYIFITYPYHMITLLGLETTNKCDNRIVTNDL